MRRPPTLKTIEVFASVQGEGLRQGEPTVFVRLAGCNRRCGFCDTKKAWRGGRETPVTRMVEEVGRLRRDLPAAWVCLTGGEPLAQDVRPLVRRLHDEGLMVQVETNGTFPPDPAADWITLSPKPPDYDFHPGFIERAREVKLVVCRALTLDAVRSVRSAFPRETPLILQPQSKAAWSRKKASKMLEDACRAVARSSFSGEVGSAISDWRLTIGDNDPILKTRGRDENMYRSPIIGGPHSVAYVAVFLDIPKPTPYHWMQQGDLPYEDHGGLTDRHINIEDTMPVKAAKRPGRPKKRDAERVRNRPVNYELGVSLPSTMESKNSL